MVYVVERYLPGLSRSDLLRELALLERTRELRDEPGAVRYLGSTIVLGDEAWPRNDGSRHRSGRTPDSFLSREPYRRAITRVGCTWRTASGATRLLPCFCHLETHTEAAVADADRRAGLPFDRIVAAVTVQRERRTTMNVSTTIPRTVEIRRGRLLGLIAGVAAVAAAITWAALALVGGAGSGQAVSNTTAQPSLPIPGVAVTRASAPAQSSSLPIPSVAVTRASAATQQVRAVRSIMDLTPGDLAGGGLGGYALPSGQSGPTVAEVLASMSPQARRYTEAVMNLTFAQLAAGAAGQP